MAKVKKKVSGENILYHYIQKNILDTDEITPFQKELIERLIVDLSIWIPLNVYEKMPVLLPFVVRDLSARKNKETGADEWGSSNNKGYLRDDNSLIKNIFSSCPIKSNHIAEYNKSYLGNGFVASHIWREIVGTTKLASVIPQTNSFVPNLVWIPKQISKLTDREQSYAQKLLQSISHQIYAGNNNDKYTKNIWKSLPNPKVGHKIKLDQLNFFDVSEDWLMKRSKKLQNEIDYLIQVIERSEKEDKKIKCSRYVPTLKTNLLKRNKKELIDWLLLSRRRIT